MYSGTVTATEDLVVLFDGYCLLQEVLSGISTAPHFDLDKYIYLKVKIERTY